MRGYDGEKIEHIYGVYLISIRVIEKNTKQQQTNENYKTDISNTW